MLRLGKPKVTMKASAFRKTLLDRAAERMPKATAFVVRKIKESLNRSQPYRITAKGLRVGLDPSRPGEPPKRVEGILINAIAAQIERTDTAVIGYVGVLGNSPADRYAARLELGFEGTDAAGRTVSQAPRPYLRPGVLNHRDDIVKILAGEAGG